MNRRIMKKVVYQFMHLSIVAMLMVSCSSDDSTGSSSLVGTWKMSSSSINGNPQAYYGYDRIIIREDNRAEFVWEVNQFEPLERSKLADWSRSRNLLSIEWDDNTTVDLDIEIIELSNQVLRWEIRINDTDRVLEVFQRD